MLIDANFYLITGPTEREVPLETDKKELIHLNISNPNVISQGTVPDDSHLSSSLEENWDDEIREEFYQDALDTCNARKNLNSALIDSFQNNVNRYPPCFHAYSPTACYDSLVYKNSEKNSNGKMAIEEKEEGQFDDAEE